MKTKILIISFTLFQLAVYAQNESNIDFISRLQGIKQVNTTFFELEGYVITTENTNFNFTSKNLKKLRRKFHINKKLSGFSDNEIESQNVIYRKKVNKNEELTEFTSHYFVESEKKRLITFYFSSINKQDTILEKQFVKAFLKKHIPESIYIPLELDSIDFAGRKIALGKSCRWMSVHNVQCPYYGQMNWSLHKNLEDAQLTMNAQYLTIKSRKMGKIIESKDINVVFEGNETTAKRVIYKIKIPSLIIGGSNVLIVYFVASKVRNTYISCVLSHYTSDSVMNTGLPPLLEKVMTIKSND